MIVAFSRIYILFLLVASLSLLWISPSSREYFLQSFNNGDSAYCFYNDFPIFSNKPTLLYSCLAVLSIAFLFFLRKDRKESTRWLRKTILSLVASLFLLLWWPSAAVVILLFFLVEYPWSISTLSDRQFYGFLLALLLVAFAFRMEKLPNVIHQPLQPDSQQYVTYSQEWTWFYDTNHREPLLAWIDWGLSSIYPVPSDLSQHGYPPIRILTLLLSCACVGMTYAFGTRFFSHSVGMGAALLMVVNKALIYRSLQGIREELVILLTLAFIGLSWTPTRSKNSWNTHTLIQGFLGALLLLTRTACLPIVFFSFLWTTWNRKQTLKQILVAMTICLLPAIPYYLYCWSHYGDPLYSGNAHIRFYYHAFFGEYPPGDQRISPFQFMFQIFAWYESIFYTLIGTLDTFMARYALRIFYLPMSVFWIGCSLVGYLRWLRNPEKRIFLYSLFLLLGPMAFFMGILIHAKTVFDWRLVVHLFPWMAYASMEGLFFLLEQAAWIPRKPPPPSSIHE